MLPSALAVGVPYELFWHLTPKKIDAFYKANKIQRQIKDEEMWMLGQYVMSALDATVCNTFLWRKKGEKCHSYIEKPILLSIVESDDKKKISTELTDEEKKKQTEQLFMKLKIMGTNFNLNKEKNRS